LLSKRLEAGSFQLPPIDGQRAQVEVDGTTFASLLAGIDFTAARRGGYRRRIAVRPGGIDKRTQACSFAGVTEVEALRAENAALRARIDGLVMELAKLNERLDVLLAAAGRKQRPPAAPRPPTPPPALDAQAREAFEGRPKAT
jgi:hypothetical protein